MLDDLARVTRDAVLVYHSNRLRRRPKEFEEFVEVCDRAGMRHVVTAQGDARLGTETTCEPRTCWSRCRRRAEAAAARFAALPARSSSSTGSPRPSPRSTNATIGANPKPPFYVSAARSRSDRAVVTSTRMLVASPSHAESRCSKSLRSRIARRIER